MTLPRVVGGGDGCVLQARRRAVQGGVGRRSEGDVDDDDDFGGENDGSIGGSGGGI